jgi:hypothetical protein
MIWEHPRKAYIWCRRNTARKVTGGFFSCDQHILLFFASTEAAVKPATSIWHNRAPAGRSFVESWPHNVQPSRNRSMASPKGERCKGRADNQGIATKQGAGQIIGVLP